MQLVSVVFFIIFSSISLKAINIEVISNSYLQVIVDGLDLSDFFVRKK